MTMLNEEVFNNTPETTQEQTLEQTQAYEAPVYETPAYTAPVAEPAYNDVQMAKTHLVTGKQIGTFVGGGMAAGWLAKTLFDKVKTAVKEKMGNGPKTKIVPQVPFRAPFKKVVIEEPAPETHAAGEANAPAPNQAPVANEAQTQVTEPTK